MAVSPGSRRSRRSASIRQLRREAEAHLAMLDLPAMFDIEQLCRHVSRERRRPLQLIPMTIGASHPCGMWVASAVADLIVYVPDTTRTHQEHIIAHELAHIICCHRGAASLDDNAARLFFPDLDPELLKDILGRSGYTDRQEQEAEIMASLILKRTNRGPIERTWAIPEENADVVRRIESSIGPGHPTTE